MTLRGFIFTIVSSLWTALECLAHSWLLFAKRPFLPYAVGYVRRQDFLHRHLLGLNYRIIGELPRHGPALIAMQHQSAWETLKLHLLFDDPAVVLKRELLDIPLWGSFAARVRMIPIDRSAGSEAVPEMLARAREAALEGRPIVIFPQGTRVAAGEQRPYRSGVARIAEATGLPIIPVALNSGLFWPKKLFGQRAGTVTLQVLPSIPPTLPQREMLVKLASSLDTAGTELANQPLPPRKSRLRWGLVAILAAYCAAWLAVSTIVENRIMGWLQHGLPPGIQVSMASHAKSGFPFSIRQQLKNVSVTSGSGTLTTPRLDIDVSVFPRQRIAVSAPAGAAIAIPAGQSRTALTAGIENLRGKIDLATGDSSFAASGISIIGLLPAGTLSAETMLLSVSTDADRNRRTIFNGLHLHLPGESPATLGNDIRRLTVDATVTGTWPTLTRQALAAWRDAGGTVEIHEFSADWGALGLGAGGTLALDNQFQPTGAFTARISGYQEIIEALVGDDMLKPSHAMLIGAALGTIAHPEGPDHVPVIDIPVTFQDQTVYLTSFKLCPLPRLGLY